MKKLILLLAGVVFSQLVFSPAGSAYAQTQFRIYCYNKIGMSNLANPLECWSANPFDENTIVWNNKPKKISLLAEIDKIDSATWYDFSSPELTQYVDSMVTNKFPVVFCIKRKIQNRNDNMWFFTSKEQGGTASELIYNGQPVLPQYDAIVYELYPFKNYAGDYLWACDYDSSERQESFIQFNYFAGIEENLTEKQIYLNNTPNPFTSETYIKYNVPQNGLVKVNLAIYDVSGKIIKTLIDKYQTQGQYKIFWNGKNKNGSRVNPGVYFCQLKILNSIKENRKLILLRYEM